MDFIQSLPLISIVFCLTGLVLIVSAFYFTSASREFEQSGIEVDGVVFTSEQKLRDTFDNNTILTKEVTIRFVTKEELWITAKPQSDLLVSLIGQYKEGETVKVIYNPNNPQDFMIKSKLSRPLLKGILIAFGFILILAGIFTYFNS